MTIIAAGLPWIAAGVLVGVVAGAIPGFGGSNTLAVLLPLTLFLEIHPALLFVVGLFVGIRFGGAVPAILVNVPGTASGSVTALEGYPMRQKGQANFALGVALAASVLGSMVSGLLALIVAPTIATIALKFSAPEIFALSIFSIAMVGQIAGDDLMKGWLAGAASLLVGSVGIDPMWGSERGTMGFVELSDGTPIVPALVGLYGVAEVMALAERTYSASTDRVSYLHQTLILRAREVFRGLLFTLRRPESVRRGLIGTSELSQPNAEQRSRIIG